MLSGSLSFRQYKIADFLTDKTCTAQNKNSASNMGKCQKHPERETEFVCLKHNQYKCQECMHCSDPKLYCKFRSACPIAFMEKNGETWGDEEK